MDELSGKRIPFSAEAERAVIGSMLISPVCAPDVMEKLNADEFYVTLNKNIYETLYSMAAYGLTIDPVTLIERMKIGGVYTQGCEEYITDVVYRTPTAANVMEYVTIIKDRALLRKLGEAADEINKMVYEGSGEADSVLEASERLIYTLRNGRSLGGLVPVSSIINKVFANLSEAAKAGSKIPGISTGFTDLDDILLGLNKTELIIVAARPGIGKTSLALNMALDAAMKSKKSVAIFSLEMSREQLVTRLLSKASLVPSKNLLTGQLSESQWMDITSAAQELSKTDIRIDDNTSLTVSEMSAQCRRFKNLDLVVIDYLQLMESAGTGHSYSNENRTQAVSAISRMMKVMAKELNVPVICLSQLSRDSVKGGSVKKPQLSDLRDSGSIEQDADVVIGLHREGAYSDACEDPNLAEAIVLKNRKGRQGTVELRWLPDITSFGDASKNRDEDY